MVVAMMASFATFQKLTYTLSLLQAAKCVGLCLWNSC